MERRITELIEESCLASSRGEQRLALDRAKEASSKERSLIRMQEQAGLSETHNLDLTFSVCPVYVIFLNIAQGLCVCVFICIYIQSICL